MTLPQSEAAKLLPSSDHEWHPVGDGTPLNVWLETKREGEDGTNICFCRVLSLGEEPEWIEQPPHGRTTVTHHSFAAPTHWRWNTCPQPAPSAGEPDFFSSLNEPQRETIAKLREILKWSHHTDIIVRKDGQDYHFQADWLRRALDHLGLSARPKIEDAEVAKVVSRAREWPRDCEGALINELADLLERLAGELAEVTVDRDEWKQQHENLVGVRQTDIANLASKIDGLKVELDRRKGDPRTRLHNLCEALQEDLDKSPYTREEWEQVDREIVELQRKLRAAEFKLAECEAELAKADAVVNAMTGSDFYTYGGRGERQRNLTEWYQQAVARHAARQQQKDKR